MSDLMSLLDQYGSISRIPEADLSSIGMARVEKGDGAVEIMSAAKLEERLRVESNQSDIFGVLLFNVTLKGVSFGHISKDRVNQFGRYALEIRCGKNVYKADKPTINIDYDPIGFLLAEDSILNKFRLDFEEYLTGELGFLSSEATTILRGPIDSLANYDAFSMFTDNELFDALTRIVRINSAITVEDIQSTYEKLEGIRNQLNDTPLYLQKFDQSIGRKYEKNDLGEGLHLLLIEISDSASDIAKELINENCSVAELYLELIPRYLKDKGLVGIAHSAESCESFDELRKYLATVRKSDLPAYINERELGSEIRSAPREKKRQLSLKLKEAKQATKNELLLVKSVRDFISLPETIGTAAASYLKKMQDVIVSKSASDEITLYLDGKPHAREDSNPGEVVDDCTKGKPLPFYLPNLFNVKVRPGLGADPIGFVYLFETTIGSMNAKTDPVTGKLSHVYSEKKRSDEKVWHMDAIQIPKRGDWEEGIENLLGAVIPKAKEAGVKYITVNDKWNLISNFDYVGKSVIDYHNKNGAETIGIKQIEGVAEGYSNLQAGLVQRVLWKRE